MFLLTKIYLGRNLFIRILFSKGLQFRAVLDPEEAPKNGWEKHGKT